MHQSELRVPVTQVLNLCLRAIEAMVALAEIALLVLPLAVYNTTYGQYQYADLTSKVDGVAIRILWRIIRYVSPLRVLAAVEVDLCSSFLTYQVDKIPPAVPSVTTYAVDTDRTAGPAALFAAQARKPGPPGKAPMVMRNIPP
jgi:hypothetical protein